MQHTEGEERAADGHPSRRPVLAGVAVREEDLEPTRGLGVATAVVLLLALVQFGVWWMDRPPGGVGLGLLVGDTIKLIVFSALLWAGADLTAVLIKTHYDIRATRILMARQTYMMKQMGIFSGALGEADDVGHRRVDDAA